MMHLGNGTLIFKDSQSIQYPFMTLNEALTPLQRSKIPSPSPSHFPLFNFSTTETSGTNVVEKNGQNAIAMVLLVLSLMIIIVGTIVGNILVCVAVCLVRKLRRPYNYLLVSLAVSDLCVAILVMPMALLHELLGKWQFGQMACDVWVSFDVLSCTASILNLCMISVDRYLAITKPLDYGVKRTPKRMIAYIFFVWIGAAFVSVPPVLILGNEHGDGSICQVCQNFWYQIYATFGSFYIPLTVMVVVYYKIFQAAKRIVNEERKAQIHLKLVADHGKHQPFLSKLPINGSAAKSPKGDLALPQSQPTSTTSRCIVVQINNGEVESKLAPCCPSHEPGAAMGQWAASEQSKYNSSFQKSQRHSFSQPNEHSASQNDGSQILEVPHKGSRLRGNSSPVSTTTTCESSWSLNHNPPPKDSKTEIVSLMLNYNQDDSGRDDPKDSDGGGDFTKKCSLLPPGKEAKESDQQLRPGVDIEIDITSYDEDEENASLASKSQLSANNTTECFSSAEKGTNHESDMKGLKANLVVNSRKESLTPKDKWTIGERFKKGIHKMQQLTELPSPIQSEDSPPQTHPTEKGHDKGSDGSHSPRRVFLHHPKSKLRLTLAKERKASTTLGIIMSAFIICWLPFFVLALVRPFLTENDIPNSISSLFLWLGYANSLLNPIIYATLNKDFRKPFQEILCLRCSSLNLLMREEFYHSQYGPDTPNHSHVRCSVNPRDQETFGVGGSTVDCREYQHFTSTSQQEIFNDSRF